MRNNTIHTLLLILALTGLGLSTIEKLSQFKDMTVHKGGDVIISLARGFNFDSAKFPLKIESDVGKGYTYQTELFHKQLEDVQDIKASIVMDNNKVLIFQKSSNDLILQEFGGANRFDKDIIKFPAGVDAKFDCQDAIFDVHTGAIILACIAPGEGENPPIITVKTFDLKGQVIGADTRTENDGFVIKNRVNLQIYREKPNEAQFLLILSDTKLENGKDEDIDAKVRVYKIFGKNILPTAVLTLKDPDNLLGTIESFEDFRNDILIVSKRKDSGEKLCLTKAILDLSNSDTQSLTVGKAFQCTEITSGTVLVAYGDKLITYDKTSKTLRSYETTADFSAPKWIRPKFSKEADLKGVAHEGAIRTVHASGDSMIIKMSTDKGINDTGDNTIVVATDNDYIFNLKESTGVLINNNLIKFTPTRMSVYHLADPHLRVDGDELEIGTKVITIKISEAPAPGLAQTPAVEQTLAVNVYKDLFSVLTLKQTESNRKPTEIFPGGVHQHLFFYDEITAGNDVQFKLGYQTEVKTQVTGLALEYMPHKMTFNPPINTFEIDRFLITHGAIIIADKKTDTINWYKCLPDNEYETGCIREKQTKRYGKQLGGDAGALLEVIYTTEYNEDQNYSYFSWVQIDDDWQYEHYKGRILDVDLIQTADKRVFSILTFSDRIVVSIFYENWYYGNRKSVVLDNRDVNDYNFCPQYVNPIYSEDGSPSSTFSVVSNCDNDHEVLNFVIASGEGGLLEKGEFKVFPLETFFIGNKLKSPTFCFIQDEVIIYEAVGHKVYSYVREFENLVELPMADLEATPQAFECYEDRQEFHILTRKNGGEGATDTMELVVMRGGKLYDVMNRIKARIRGISTDAVRFSSFNHGQDTSFVFLSSSNAIVTSVQFFEKGPHLVTKIADDFTYAEKTFTYKIDITTRGSKSEASFGHSMKVLPGFRTLTANVETKITMEKKLYDILDHIKVEGGLTKIELQAPAPAGLGQTPQKIVLRKTKISDTNENLGNEPAGRFQRFTTGETDFDLVSSFSEDTRLHFGGIKLFKDRKLADTFYNPIAFKTANFIKAKNGDLLTVYSPDFDFMPLKVAVARGGKFSYKSLPIGGVGSRAENIFIANFPGEDNRFTVFWTNKGILSAVGFKYSFGNDGVDDWSIQMMVDSDVFLADFISRSYGYAINATGVNFYAEKKGDTTKIAYRVSFNLATNTFGKVNAIDLGDGENFSEVRSVSCVNENAKDKCAWATAGSVIYYSEFAEALALGLTQGPVPTATLTLRLRRPVGYYGDKVRVAGRFVVMETARLSTTDSRYLAVWDLKIAQNKPAALTQGEVSNDILPSYLTPLVRENSSQNLVDSYLVSVTPSTETNGVTSAEAFVEIEDPETEENFVISKKLLPWTLEVSELIDPAVYKDYKLKLYGVKPENFVTVTLEDLFNAPAALEGDDVLVI